MPCPPSRCQDMPGRAGHITCGNPHRVKIGGLIKKFNNFNSNSRALKHVTTQVMPRSHRWHQHLNPESDSRTPALALGGGSRNHCDLRGTCSVPCAKSSKPSQQPRGIFTPTPQGELATPGYPVELGSEHRTNSSVCVLPAPRGRSATDSGDLSGPRPRGPITRGPAATLFQAGRRPRSADTSSEDSASREIGAGERRFSTSGSGWGHRRTCPFSPLSPTPGAEPALPERLSRLLPVLLPAQLSAPAAPGPRAVGPPPFGAACHPARTLAGADPQGLRARLLALSGCGLGRGCSRGRGCLVHGAWPRGAGQPE